LTIWLGLAAYLLTVPLSTFGVGLCHGEDGHVTLELVYAGKCQPLVTQKGYSSGLSSAGLSSAEYEHTVERQVLEQVLEQCGPCIDTSLEKEALILKKRNVSLDTFSQLLPKTGPIFPGLNSHFGPHFNPHFREPASVRNASFLCKPDISVTDLLFQQTIILLI